MDSFLTDAGDLTDIIEIQYSENAEVRNPLSHRNHGFARYIDSITDVNFKKRFRLSKASFFSLCEQIQLMPKRRGNYIDPEIDVLCLLRYLCTGSFLEVSGDLLKISKASSHRAVHRIMRLVASLADEVIKLPEDIRKVENDFFDLYGFPLVVGAIDCTHIQIQSVGGPLAEVFRNRKGTFSINVQCICDPQLRFIDSVVRWPGSTHDSRILENSHIHQKFESGLIHGLLLGDAGYPLKNWLMTPLANPQTISEKSKYFPCSCFKLF